MPIVCKKTGLPGRGSAYKEDAIGNVYSYKQCIRTHDETLGYIFNVTKYSRTTTGHQSVSHKAADYPKNYISVSFSTEFLVTPSDMVKQAREKAFRNPVDQ
jgi:hypothetical protein